MANLGQISYFSRTFEKTILKKYSINNSAMASASRISSVSFPIKLICFLIQLTSKKRPKTFLLIHEHVKCSHHFFRRKNFEV